MTTDMVVVRQSIPGSSHKLWSTLVDLPQTVATLPDVRRIALTPGTGKRLIDWTVWLKGFELQWQEEQVLDARAMRIEFRQTQGMFACYRGSWQVNKQDQHSELEIQIEIDSGIPHLSQYVNPVLAKAFEAFARELAEACLRAHAVVQ